MKRNLSLRDLPPRKKGECRWCGAPVGKGRRTWCSQACVDQYLVRSDPVTARRLVYGRDRGVCALCGLNTVRLAAVARAELRRVEALAADSRRDWPQPLRDLWRVLVLLDGFPYEVPVSWGWRGPHSIKAARLWQADHVVSVAEGGGACGLENLRTLCAWCHPRETGALRRRLNAARRPGA